MFGGLSGKKEIADAFDTRLIQLKKSDGIAWLLFILCKEEGIEEAAQILYFIGSM